MSDLSQNVLDSKYSRINFKQAKGYDNTKTQKEVLKAEEILKSAKGGKVSSASFRGDGCCQRGKTKGRMV